MCLQGYDVTRGGGGVSTRLGLHFYILNIEKEKYEVQMLQ